MQSAVEWNGMLGSGIWLSGKFWGERFNLWFFFLFSTLWIFSWGIRWMLIVCSSFKIYHYLDYPGLHTTSQSWSWLWSNLGAQWFFITRYLYMHYLPWSLCENEAVRYYDKSVLCMFVADVLFFTPHYYLNDWCNEMFFSYSYLFFMHLKQKFGSTVLTKLLNLQCSLQYWVWPWWWVFCYCWSISTHKSFWLLYCKISTLLFYPFWAPSFFSLYWYLTIFWCFNLV